ncbi:MAG TPA: hemerythrin domain-containing protein [Alphaproteobacteria bacterium]
MDIYQVIKQDHDRMRAMLEELCATENGDAARREELFVPFKNELLMHQHVEEAVVYHRLKEIEETRAEALEAINEHHLADVLAEELAIMPKDSDEWFAKFGVLRELIEHHMKEEEGEFFAAARKVIDAPLAREMAEQMREKKEAGLAALQPIG